MQGFAGCEGIFEARSIAAVFTRTPAPAAAAAAELVLTPLSEIFEKRFFLAPTTGNQRVETGPCRVFVRGNGDWCGSETGGALRWHLRDAVERDWCGDYENAGETVGKC